LEKEGKKRRSDIEIYADKNVLKERPEDNSSLDAQKLVQNRDNGYGVIKGDNSMSCESQLEGKMKRK
jgi:hypothetical protein